MAEGKNELWFDVSTADNPNMKGNTDLVEKVNALSKWHFERTGERLQVTSMLREGDTGSHHGYGEASDLWSQNLADNAELRREFEAMADKLELNAKDEWEDPVAWTTGGHMHVNTRTNYVRGVPWDGYSPLTNMMLAEADATTLHGISKKYLNDLDEQEKAFNDRMKREQASRSDASFTDGFLNQFKRSIAGGLISSMANDSNKDYTFTEDDQNFVIKHLNGDTMSQQWVYSNAHSRQQLEELVEQRVADLERAKRVSGSDWLDDSTLGSMTGFILGEALNPLNYIGVGLIQKGNLAVRAISAGALNAAINVADSNVRQRLTGYEENFKWAAGAGALAGMATTVGSHLLSRFITKESKKVLEETVEKATRIGEDAKAIVNGLDSASAVKTGASKASAIQELVMSVKGVAPDVAKALTEGGEVVVSRKNAKRLARVLGQEIAEDTKVLKTDNLTILFDDAIEGANNKTIKAIVSKALGLKSVATEAKQKLLDIAREHMRDIPTSNRVRQIAKTAEKWGLDKTDGAWDEAMKRAMAITPKGKEVNPEVVLGFYADIMERDSVNSYFYKIRREVRKVMGDKNLSNEDVIKLLKDNSLDLASKQKPFTPTPDGGAIIGNIKVSDTNMVNPAPIEQMSKVVRDACTLFGIKVPKDIADNLKFLEGLGDHNPLNRTGAGTFMQSKISSLKNFGMRLVKDAQQRIGSTMHSGLVAEQVKAQVMAKITPHWKQLNEDISKYLMSKGKLGTAGARQEAWEQIVRYHDWHFADNGVEPEGVDDLLKKCAERLHLIETEEVRLAKEFGYLPSDWKGANGTRRVTDLDKLRKFQNEFMQHGGVTGSENFLEEYARVAMGMKRKANQEIYMSILKEKFDDAMAIYEKKLEHWKSKGSIGDEPVKPIMPKYNEEDFLKYMDAEAHKWAFGQTDRGKAALLTDIKRGARGEAPIVRDHTSGMPWTHQRTVMDTSLEMPMPNGKTFSYDNILRDYDFDFILERTTNRWSGEIALHDALNNHGAFGKFTTVKGEEIGIEATVDNARNIIVAEAEELIAKGVEHGGITRRQAEKEIADFDRIVAMLCGVGRSGEGKSEMEIITQILQNYTYAIYGGNMGFNQMAEMGGSIGYAGFKQLSSVLPVGQDFVKKVIVGDKLMDAAKKAELALFGEDMRIQMLANAKLLKSSIGQELDHFGLLGNAKVKLLEAMDIGGHLASTITSEINCLPKLTASMEKSLRQFAYVDLTKFARGKEPGWLLRKPLSEVKLRAIDVFDKEGFRKKLATFLDKDGILDLNTMAVKDKDLYNQVYNFMDTAAKRAITMDTIGNRNLVTEGSWTLRLLYQFKSFTNMATSTQTFRMLNSRERDDIMASMFSLFMTAGVTAGMAYCNGYARYGHDKTKRDAYIQKRIGGKNLMYASLLRSSVLGSPLSPINDINEAGNFGWFGDAGTIRTTVDRDFRKNRRDMTPSDFMSNIVSQLPALRTADNFVEAGRAGYNTARYGLNKRDLQKFSQLVPAKNFAGVQSLLQEMIYNSNLPQKRGK